MKNPIGHLSNLQQRIIAGVIGAFLLFAGILAGKWALFTLLICMNLLCLNEFYLLLQKNNIPVNRTAGLIISVLFLIAYQWSMNASAIAIPMLLFSLFIVELFQKNINPFSRIGHTVLGLIYITLPFYLLQGMTVLYAHNTYDPSAIIAILLLVWASDIGGYVAGLNFGKHKLFERISPKKTWEGAAGSLIFAIVIASIIDAGIIPLLSQFPDHFYLGPLKGLSTYQWLGLGIVIVIFGILGDLIESMLKRSLGVKDSGNTIPGHGGFLDRFDAFVFVIPFAWAYFTLIFLYM